MSSISDQMQVEFHNRAKEKLFLAYRSFQNTVSRLSRRTEEYRFQHLKQQHTATMEQELRSIAKDILDKNKCEKQSREVDQMFHQLIRDYLHHFIQKVNAF